VPGSWLRAVTSFIASLTFAGMARHCGSLPLRTALK